MKPFTSIEFISLQMSSLGDVVLRPSFISEVFFSLYSSEFTYCEYIWGTFVASYGLASLFSGVLRERSFYLIVFLACFFAQLFEFLLYFGNVLPFSSILINLVLNPFFLIIWPSSEISIIWDPLRHLTTIPTSLVRAFILLNVSKISIGINPCFFVS